jgi:hypothetical protein
MWTVRSNAVRQGVHINNENCGRDVEDDVPKS